MTNREIKAQVNDKVAVQDVLSQLVACWNRGDGRAYGELFTEDADYIDVTGTRTQGGEAIGQTHQFLFDGPLKGATLEGDGTDVETHFLAPDVALCIGGGGSRLQGQTETPENRKSINTTVLVKRSGRWRIRAFQNNRVQSRPFGLPTRTNDSEAPR